MDGTAHGDRDQDGDGRSRANEPQERRHEEDRANDDGPVDSGRSLEGDVQADEGPRADVRRAEEEDGGPHDGLDVAPLRAPYPPTYRHTLATRLCHWITVACLAILVPSGFQIFNAHPALYWGERSDRDRPLLAMEAHSTDSSDLRGVTVILGHPLDTTGVLGVSMVDGERVERGFPAWATLPSERWLAMGRRWHLFFAWVFVLNGLVFGGYAVLSRHLTRDLIPSRHDWASMPRSLLDHLRFRFPSGEARQYNVLQKMAYVAVIGVLGPLVVVTGLAMSPWVDAAVPVLPAIFGGRQSARTVHFLATFAFLGFTALHLFMVTVTGVLNNIRAIVTGWSHMSKTGESHEHQ